MFTQNLGYYPCTISFSHLGKFDTLAIPDNTLFCFYNIKPLLFDNADKFKHSISNICSAHFHLIEKFSNTMGYVI